MSRVLRFCCLPAIVLALAAAAQAAPAGLDQNGKPDLKSAGALAFGPKGVLFVGDPQGAQIVAIDVGTAPKDPIGGNFKLEGADQKIAALLGTKADDITINDVAVEPGTNIAYVSVARGKGPSAEPAIVRIDGKGNVTMLPLDKVAYAKVALANAPAAGATDKKGQSLRSGVITDLAFVDGKLFIAGLSNEEFASKLRSIEFPFKGADTGASVEIFHTNHNAVETRSPVRTFVPFNVGGQPQILAAYTCTPLVTFPVADLKAGQKVHGKTVAELGNRNQPIDMIVYEKDGKQFLLLSNSARGMMKISTENIDKQPALETKVPDKAGLTYETIQGLENVDQLDKLGNANALVLSKGTLSAIALP
ncbi:MAG: hypothetical protein JF612_01205 [Planctomycetia bacterium]|jgi:hypothetical protein|nr:hypothetical protein [Planctomycetia bacterium]